MKIRIVSPAVHEGALLAPGIIIDLPDDAATTLIARRAATALDAPAPQPKPKAKKHAPAHRQD